MKFNAGSIRKNDFLAGGEACMAIFWPTKACAAGQSTLPQSKITTTHHQLIHPPSPLCAKLHSVTSPLEEVNGESTLSGHSQTDKIRTDEFQVNKLQSNEFL